MSDGHKKTQKTCFKWNEKHYSQNQGVGKNFKSLAINSPTDNVLVSGDHLHNGSW